MYYFYGFFIFKAFLGPEIEPTWPLYAYSKISLEFSLKRIRVFKRDPVEDCLTNVNNKKMKLWGNGKEFAGGDGLSATYEIAI